MQKIDFVINQCKFYNLILTLEIMSKGFSREDDLIKKLKNCLGTLPDQ